MESVMAKSRKLLYAALTLASVWILLAIIAVGLHKTLPPYPHWLDFALAGVMFITAIILASRAVSTKRLSLGVGLLIGTIVLLSVMVVVGAASGGFLQWLREGLAIATVLVLLFQYFRARRDRQSKNVS